MAEYKPAAQFSHARAILKLDGEIIGGMSDCSGGERIEWDEAQPAGQLEVAGHVATAYRVHFTASFFFMVLKSMSDTGLWPGKPKDIIEWPEINAEIEDTVTNTTIFLVKGVKPSARDWNISQGTLTMENCEFVAKTMESTNNLTS